MLVALRSTCSMLTVKIKLAIMAKDKSLHCDCPIWDSGIMTSTSSQACSSAIASCQLSPLFCSSAALAVSSRTRFPCTDKQLLYMPRSALSASASRVLSFYIILVSSVWLRACTGLPVCWPSTHRVLEIRDSLLERWQPLPCPCCAPGRARSEFAPCASPLLLQPLPARVTTMALCLFLVRPTLSCHSEVAAAEHTALLHPVRHQREALMNAGAQACLCGTGQVAQLCGKHTCWSFARYLACPPSPYILRKDTSEQPAVGILSLLKEWSPVGASVSAHPALPRCTGCPGTACPPG